jgi:TonB family protein
MPEWTPPSLAAKFTVYRGLLELVIDEHGNVKSATLRQPIAEHYDEQLLAAAKNWKYRPAKRNGIPVEYRTFLEIALQPKK